MSQALTLAESQAAGAAPSGGVRPGAGNRLAWILAGAAGAVAGTGLHYGHPLLESLPACALREAFHVGCATCGLTRAFELLARGEIGASFAAHPLAIPLAIEIVAAWLLWGIGAWTGRWMLRARGVARAIAITVLAAIAVWVARLATGTLPV